MILLCKRQQSSEFPCRKPGLGKISLRVTIKSTGRFTRFWPSRKSAFVGFTGQKMKWLNWACLAGQQRHLFTLGINEPVPPALLAARPALTTRRLRAVPRNQGCFSEWEMGIETKWTRLNLLLLSYTFAIPSIKKLRQYCRLRHIQAHQIHTTIYIFVLLVYY